MSTSIRVRYADTDAQGVVYHGAFFTFFEVARFELLRRLLGGKHEATRLWSRLAIASARCDYRGAIRYPEEISVDAFCSAVGDSSFEVSYRIYNARQEVVAEGATVQVHMGQHGQPYALPDEIRARLVASAPTAADGLNGRGAGGLWRRPGR